MKRIKCVLSWLILSISLLIAEAAVAVDVVGELETNLYNTVNSNGEIDSSLQEGLELELILPESGSTEAKFALEVINSSNIDMSGSKVSFYLHKLYLKHRFTDFYLTLGRQPISWSFGSMFNPVDFNQNVLSFAGDSVDKYQDAVKAYFPINWNTNLSLAAAYPDYSKEIKWGIRGRTVIEGYDLTLNYVREVRPSVGRVGLTAKGDLGPVGVYGAVGYYLPNAAEDKKLVYLIGGDYSYYFNYGQQVTMQMEYSSDLNPFSIKKTDLLLGNINYTLDEFSILGLIVITNLADGSLIWGPTYSTELGNNVSLDIRGAVCRGEQETLFSPEEFLPFKGSLNLSLAYSF